MIVLCAQHTAPPFHDTNVGFDLDCITSTVSIASFGGIACKTLWCKKIEGLINRLNLNKLINKIIDDAIYANIPRG